MGKPVAGDVVVVPFPQTDLRPGKLRPALALVDLPGDDLILCQITTQSRLDGFSISLDHADFSKGRLPVASFIRVNRLFTADQSVIVRTAGSIKQTRLQDVLAAVRKVFS